MDINDSTGGRPYYDTNYKPYLLDGQIVLIHDNFFNQTRVIQKPFQRIVRIQEDHIWIELV